MLQLIEVIGIIAFALSGVIEARRKKMDLVGVYTVAFVTAFGGGTLRDLLLNRHPLFWIENPQYPILILGIALGAVFYRGLAYIPETYLTLPDAFGLGLFSLAGAGIAANMGMPIFIAVLMGVITGTFGGVLRDVFCNEVPSLFRKTELYATNAFLGCWFYFGMQWLGVAEQISLPLAILLIAALRFLAVKYNLRLPGVE